MEQENKIVWWIQEIWLLKEHPFYNVPVRKPYIERLNNIEHLQHELPFYNELSIVKTSKRFRGYARIYSIGIIDSKDLQFNSQIVNQVLKTYLKIYKLKLKAEMSNSSKIFANQI